ncbi:MAG: hypothetical protein PVI26_10650 [Chitinispirillia bacterium]|jgi:hypothetical protein
MLKSIIIFTTFIFIFHTGLTNTCAEENKLEQVEVKELIKNEPKVNFSFHGDVNYRFRGDIEANMDISGEKRSKKIDHQHRYAWNLKAGITVSDNLLFGMRLSNPLGYITDDVVDNFNWAIGKDSNIELLTISEIYFRWNVNVLTIAGGKIPVIGNTALDLAAYEGKKYINATTSWKETMNASQLGLNLGLLLYKSNLTSLKFNTLYTIAQGERRRGKAADALKNDQLRFIFSLPLTFIEPKMSFEPVLHFRTNIDRSFDNKKGNHSLAGGLDINFLPIEQVGFTVGYAIGGFRNDSHEDETGYIASAPLGILVKFGVAAQPGYGTIKTEFKFSNSQDREAFTTVNYNQLYWDIQYDMPIKGLTITPRMRAWHGFNDIKNDDSIVNMLLPALILSAQF